MRLGYAIDLHAPADDRAHVAWPLLRDQAVAAEDCGLDIVVLPDHLYYAPGGDNPYALPDAPVGVWESVAVAGALAAATSRVVIGHSMVNTPYRAPALVANVAATLDEVSGGRYSLGLGSGNSFDYDELGIDATDRHARFAESVAIIATMLAGDAADLAGEHVSARGAELVLRHRGDGPPLVVAAAGPRSRRLAARFGDGVNLWAPVDEAHDELADAIADVRRACEEIGRDPDDLVCTVDTAVDALDLHDARDRSRRSLERLAELGVDETRCYVPVGDGPETRLAAVTALAELRP